MTALHDILAAGHRVVPGRRQVTIPADWLQGRTCYGGLSAALALDAVLREIPDLPPLRSAQVAFIGPLAGEVEVATQLLRRGRNAAFVQADVTGADGLGLRCTFVFMRRLDSTIDHDASPMPCLPPVAGEASLAGAAMPAFARQFEMVDRPMEGVGWRRWIRLAQRNGTLPPAVELLAIGDALPPAAMRLATQRVPLSSLTWMVNVLAAEAVTGDGWWLVESQTDHARGGVTSQAMAIRDGDGRKVAEQMQAAAIFG